MMSARKSIAASFLFHGLILALLYSIYVEINTPSREFISLSVGNLGALPPSRLVPANQVLSSISPALLKGPPPPTERIGEPVTIAKPEPLVAETASLVTSRLKSGPTGTTDDKALTVTGDVNLPFGDDTIGIAQPFFIEGRAANRRLISQVLPEYPTNYQKEAVVTLSFGILPSGLITRIAIERKGDPVLEPLAIEALRQFVFEPVPESEGVADGRITFVFKMR